MFTNTYSIDSITVDEIVAIVINSIRTGIKTKESKKLTIKFTSEKKRPLNNFADSLISKLYAFVNKDLLIIQHVPEFNAHFAEWQSKSFHILLECKWLFNPFPLYKQLKSSQQMSKLDTAKKLGGK